MGAVAGAVLLALSCGNPGRSPARLSPPAGRAWAEPAPPGPESRALAQRLRAAGGLRVATTRTETIYEPAADGSSDGFMINLAKAFAAWLELPLLVEEVQFEDFFTVDGELRAEAGPRGGSPDLFRRVDLYVAALAPLPWRAELMRFLPVIPSRIMAISRRDSKISAVADLAGKTAVVIKSTSFESLAESLAARTGAVFPILRVADDAGIWEALETGKADFSLLDSSSIIVTLGRRSGLVAGAPLSDLQMLGWATRKDATGLAAAFEEFLAGAKADGSFNRIWSAYYGISLDDYHGLIRYAPREPLRLTAAEKDWVEAARKRGGLRIAIPAELSIYEPRADGSVGGLHYDLARRLAEALDLPLKATIVGFERFFSKGGVVPDRAKTDPSYSYTPDLLGTVDLYVGALTPLPWRQKFLRFVDLFPTNLVYLSPEGSVVNGPADFKGRRAALLPNTSYEGWLAEVSDGRPPLIVAAATGEDAFRLVAEGKAEFTVSDANLALARIKDYPGLRITPASPELSSVSWAVAKDNEVLAGILGAWVASIRKDGSFEEAWAAYYRASFAEYLGIIAPAR
jgi:ABC-type amino acid transport substrate-binding protein